MFRRLTAPREAQRQALLERLAERIGRALERQGVLVREAENSVRELAPAAGGPLDDLIGHSITCRVAWGPRAGQQVFSLQTVPARAEEVRQGVAQYAGFSWHAGLAVEADPRAKLARRVRYLSRPPVAVARLDRTALVPPPRVHLTRCHGGFAPPAAWRAPITPAGRGPGVRRRAAEPERPTPKHVARSWARRLQRVFGIEIEPCARGGGRLKVIARSEEPELIERLLAHRRARGVEAAPLTPRRAPPQASLF